jgi:cytochrome c oxidase subunit I
LSAPDRGTANSASERTEHSSPTEVLTGPGPEVALHGLKQRPTGWLAWLTTTDHKKIGILYLFATFLFFILGGVEVLIMRLQLAQPNGTVVSPETYNSLLSMHGSTMIFLFVVPVWAGLANYLVPLMIGARDMAFPRLNALSFWLLLFGGVAFYASLFFDPPRAGWTSYTPLSDDSYSPSGGIDAWIFMVHLTSIASMLGAINFVATIHNMRAKGMTWGRLPLFIWSMLVYSYLLILALPSLSAAATMLLTDRHFGTDFFDPTGGGDPLLWQHLFWFFGHPEVYIMVLPAFGVISEVLPVFARKPIFGYKAVAASTIAIAFLSMLVWAHHMFTTPTATVVLAFFMISSFTIAVPTGIKIFNWLATLWRGQIVMKTPLFFAAAFLSQFVIGGITGVIMAMFPVDWQIHDTYFIVAHFHYVLFGGSAFALFAALYYWFPKMSGRMLSESAGKLSFWLMFIGFNLTFLIQHSAGLSGMPRRIYDYSSSTGWTGYNLVSSIGSFILGIGVLVTVVNVLVSLKRGRRAGNDPWHGNTLEWFVASPPPANNFDVVPRIRSAEPMIDIRREVGAASTTDETVAQPVTPAI